MRWLLFIGLCASIVSANEPIGMKPNGATAWFGWPGGYGTTTPVLRNATGLTSSGTLASGAAVVKFGGSQMISLLSKGAPDANKTLLGTSTLLAPSPVNGITVLATIYATALAGDFGVSDIVNRDNTAGTRDYQLSANNDGSLTFLVPNPTFTKDVRSTTVAGLIVTGRFYRVAGRWDGTTNSTSCSVFINGRQPTQTKVNNGGFTGYTASTNNNTCLFNRPSGIATSFLGYIADVVIIQSALSDADILEDYTKPSKFSRQP
jgi:hypothetical protein